MCDYNDKDSQQIVVDVSALKNYEVREKINELKNEYIFKLRI